MESCAPSFAAVAEIDSVSMRFGGITALSSVSFRIPEGRIVGLIGPNGAGKTTLFNCISRLYEPTSGDIRVMGASILQRSAHEMTRLGVARTFQNLALYPSMDVTENVLVGLHGVLPSSRLSRTLGLPSARRADVEARRKVAEILAATGLSSFATRRVSELTYATQKRVEIARALVCAPRLLMLDEPAGGLNQEEVAALAAFIRTLRDSHGLSVLLVEHHLNLVMTVSDQVVALNFGQKIADGTPQQVQADPTVQTAYLGEPDALAA